MIKSTLMAGAMSMLLASTLATGAMAQDRVSIGTGGTGGVFYAVGAGMADILSRNLEGVSANAEVTGASVENVRRVSNGEMTMGFSSASTLYEGKEGTGTFEGDAQNVAAIAYLYPATLQIAVSAAKALDDVADIGDLKVSVGPPGSNASVISERLLTSVDAFNLGRISFLSYGEATGAIQNGQLDGTFVLAGVPAAALIELSTTKDVKLVPVTRAQADAVIADYPFYEFNEIPAGVYAGNDDTIGALGDPAILFTAADADPELVYSITKTLFDNLEALGAVHPAAKSMTLAGATATPIALHEGAQRYFDEQ
ncbi:hypothetical protein AQS8620_02010 [Aquimixticola soesokkakensis]|uniref:NMT1/THI5 like protein n=1 Tax=Aquimixticola soesokkakensis TaxID=1519096 RepID=A0A1Y5SYQ7_9RHOB|nr:TAXI family TRAP transporter solute-binding subunit [Aquimixticola soesokkakensis]SLN48206.1 hypothetical protein AQS8620_02010 [Aquimixticola soesokkakensis]